MDTWWARIRLQNNAHPVSSLNSQANWDGIKSKLSTLLNCMQSTTEQTSVNTQWTVLKTTLLKAMQEFIPQKQIKPKHCLPWVTQRIRKLIRAKYRLHSKLKHNPRTDTKDKYKQASHTLQKETRKAYWAYLENIIDYTSEPNTQDRHTKQKRFWSFIKSTGKDSSGISPLRHQGIVHSDATSKADILAEHFSSIYTHEQPGPLPDKGPSPYSSMPDINISATGIQHILSNLKPHKAAGPDTIPPTVLKELSHQISPILEIIFNKSLQTGQVPNDWKEANVAPIFKKGDKHNPCNYRPVSLTCIISKCMEHILVSNIMQHLDSNKILYALQHGFRKNFSCDTQLLSLFQDLSSNPSQTDLIIMDFSKAFDKVPHRRLQYKLNWYSIRGTTHAWIQNFLQGRSQRVVSEGTQSSSHPVLSGVPQGTVLGPILFLIYINDLPDEASSSTIRLFADDCILYRSIKTQQDSTLLQHDLNSIAQWELTWQMKFNIDKCYTMQAGRTRHKILNTYTLHDHPLPITHSTKYLGITISNDLKWNKHISNITSKANSTLGILRRNLRLSSTSHTVKTHAYQALVRPHLEYASAVWDPHTHCNTQKLEMVQRRAARYVCNRWHNTSSVTGMLNQLEWVPLATRRANTRLCMMYRVAHTPVGDPWTPWLTFAQRTTRGSHAWKYIPISTSHDAYKFSFLPRTIIAWSQLPSIIVAAPSPFTTHPGTSSLPMPHQ